MARVFSGTFTSTVTMRDMIAAGKNVLIVWAEDWLRYTPPNGGAGYKVGNVLIPTIPSFEVRCLASCWVRR